MKDTFEHFPISVEEEKSGVFVIHQQFGSTADDCVTIRISSQQAKQIGAWLTKRSTKKTESSMSDEGFEAFWKAYPRKEGKAKALDCWRRQNLSAIQAKVINHLLVTKSTDQWTKDGGRFVPWGSTYLSQRRYLDEIDECDVSSFL